MSPLVLILISLALVGLSAVFVAVEFSLISAQRHRFEEKAATSRSARAALRSSGDLPILLAGSQLGITLCTLALGALSKPAVHHALMPVIEDIGAPSRLADVLSFVLALFIVTFVHLVVGEMMPKSWAIAHPEKSAMMLALPMRGFIVLTRPLLVVLNSFANWLLHRVNVEPSDEVAQTQDIHGLEQLVGHSAETGTLDAVHTQHLLSALALQEITVGDLPVVDRAVTAVPVDATADDVWRVAEESGHLRVLVGEAPAYAGGIHVRDTISLDADASVKPLVQPVPTYDASTPISDAMREMRLHRQHMAIVTRDGDFVRVMTFSDLLRMLFPPREAQEV